MVLCLKLKLKKNNFLCGGYTYLVHKSKDINIRFKGRNVYSNSSDVYNVIAYIWNYQFTADIITMPQWRHFVATLAGWVRALYFFHVMRSASLSPQPSVLGRSWMSCARNAALSNWVYPQRSPVSLCSWSDSGWWCTAPSSGRSAANAGPFTNAAVGNNDIFLIINLFILKHGHQTTYNPCFVYT